MKLVENRSLNHARVVLIGLRLPGDSAESLDELARLVETAEGEVAATLSQSRDRPHIKSYFGKGKMEELALLVKSKQADAVVVDDPISPGQMRQMEKQCAVPVVDRSELILDIFASRARTRLAKAQVELAFLKYSLPRLKRLWSHLDTQRASGGGTGGKGAARGMGEKQIEVDRRLVRMRIRDLSKRQKILLSRRQREVMARQEFPRVALVGYTNAGKSTLMNRLTEADGYADDKLFATLDTQTRQLSLPAGGSCLLSDSVGFIKKLPHHLVDSFHATLAEVALADLLLLVVDGSAPDPMDQVDVVVDTLRSLDALHKPTLLVINKMDDMKASAPTPEGFYLDVLSISAKYGEGCEQLLQSIQRHLEGEHVWADLRFPSSNGALYATVEKLGRIKERRIEGEKQRFTSHLSWAQLGRLRKDFAELEILEPETEQNLVFPQDF